MRSQSWSLRPPWPASAGSFDFRSCVDLFVLWPKSLDVVSVCVHVLRVYFLVVADDSKQKSRFKPVI